MREAVPYEIRQALGMPHADLAEACERIRTMRQTELCAEHLLRSGRLLPGQPAPARAPGGFAGQMARLAHAAPAAFVMTALFLSLALGWVALVDRPQADTWKSAVQSDAHPSRDVEQLLRASRRLREAANN